MTSTARMTLARQAFFFAIAVRLTKEWKLRKLISHMHMSLDSFTAGRPLLTIVFRFMAYSPKSHKYCAACAQKLLNKSTNETGTFAASSI